MKLMRVGVDLAKAVFQVHGVDRNEKVALRRKLLDYLAATEHARYEKVRDGLKLRR